MKNYLVRFECQIGEYQHIDYMLFNKKKSEWGYCKEFWGISKKDELKENCFWDDWMQNAIKVYSETEGKFYKISKQKDFRQDTPEGVALSSFFAYSNEIASRLYLDKEKYSLREDSTFEGIRKRKTKDAYIELLHKTNYNFEGNEMSYIMFIAKVNDIPLALNVIKLRFFQMLSF